MYTPAITKSGVLLQSGTPKSVQRDKALIANGLLLRGFVVATYVTDDDAHPEVNVGGLGTSSDAQVAIYCDCVVLSNIPGCRWHFLKNVLVSHECSSIQGGEVRKPKAMSMDITQTSLDITKSTLPGNTDGDCVLIGFLNNSLSEPVILRYLPHPSRDAGQEEEDIGQRLKLKLADGDPDFRKHKGGYFGISDDGDFIVDMTQAYATDLESDGKQPSPPLDGSTGNFVVRLADGSKLTIEIDGDSSKSPAISETLKSFYTSGVKGKYDVHKHPTGMGPSGIPDTLIDSYDDDITSTKVDIPDG